MHKHLTLEERHYIYLQKNASTLSEIAKKLSRSVSTISREIKTIQDQEVIDINRLILRQSSDAFKNLNFIR